MIHEARSSFMKRQTVFLRNMDSLKVSDQEYEALDKEYLLRVRKEPRLQLSDRPEELLSGKPPEDL